MPSPPVLSDELRYKILKVLQENPQISQRALARELGISLGWVNYCLKALMEKGLVVAAEFRLAKDKKRYAYMLTPRGIEDRTKVTLRFLKRKVDEYEVLEREIERLREEIKVATPAKRREAPETQT